MIELIALEVLIGYQNPLVQYLENVSYCGRFGEMIAAVGGRGRLGGALGGEKST